MNAAPPLDCADCGRRIGKGRTHILIPYPADSGSRVICVRCLNRQRQLWDQSKAFATRAGAGRTLGLWP